MEPIATLKSDSDYVQAMSKPLNGLSQDMFVLRETHKYIFFGPSRKDVKNTYFEAVYLFEKKLRIQAGQKVVLSHGKEVYGVALVGQAQNRQVWVWLVSFQTEDVMKRLIVQVSDIVGVQSPEEREMCQNALARYQRKSSSYRTFAAQQTQNPDSSGDGESSEGRVALTTRRLRSHEGSPTARPKRAKRPYNRRFDDDFEMEEEEEMEENVEYEDDSDRSDEEEITASPRKKTKTIGDQRLPQHGELFTTLLECVVLALQTEYPQRKP